MAKYEIKTGLDLPSGKRYEPGDIAEDIPPADIKWLREQGHIVLIGEDETPKASGAKKAAKGGDG